MSHALGVCLTLQTPELHSDAQVYLINEWLLERDDQTAWITLIAGKGLKFSQAQSGS